MGTTLTLTDLYGNMTYSRSSGGDDPAPTPTITPHSYKTGVLTGHFLCDGMGTMYSFASTGNKFYDV
jgi:hypothetical protein